MVEIRYQRTFEDYQEAISGPRSKSLGLKIAGVVIAGVLYLAGVILLISLGAGSGLAVLSIAIGLPVLVRSFSYAYRAWLRRDFRRHPTIGLPEIVRIDEAGLHAESEAGGGTTRWLAYTKYQETRNLHLLYLGPRMVHILPKRAFSAEQTEEFRRLVDSNVFRDRPNRMEGIKHVASS